MKVNLGAVAIGATALTLALSSAAAADPHAAKPASAAKAGTTVTIGQVDPGTTIACPALTVVQAASVGPSYTVPAGGGVITSYSHKANATAGQVRVVAFTSGGVNTWNLVGKSTLSTVTVNTLNTFATRVPVPAGAQLGLQTTSSGMGCAFTTGAAGDVFHYNFAFNPDTQTTLAATVYPAGARSNVSAVVESDADHDGFGDVTQDACPGLASTQAACPVPDTIITKKPAKVSTTSYVKIKFRSTVPGSTFMCSLDGKRFKPCSSPYTKRLGLGRHKVKVQAVSPLGLVDPTPAIAKFRITARH